MLELARTYTKHLSTRYGTGYEYGLKKKIGAASTAVPSLSNIMHIFLNIKADRPVPANIIRRRPSSLLTQHLQAYRGAKGGHAFVHHPSSAANAIIPA